MLTWPRSNPRQEVIPEGARSSHWATAEFLGLWILVSLRTEYVICRILSGVQRPRIIVD